MVDISAELIGDGGGVTLPTDPDDMAAVKELFGQFGSETFDSDSSYEGFYQRLDRYQLPGLSW